MSKLEAKKYKRFEDIKHIRNDGSGFWLARETCISVRVQ